LRAIWAGTAVKAGDVCPVLKLLMRQRYHFTVVAEKDPFESHLPRRLLMKVLLDYRFVPWHHATFPETIIGGDVCISPRDVALPYNRGHSSFKIGVFMAEGVPVMASPVPSYLELLGDGRAGWICRTPGEWDEALLYARRDRAKLRERAAAARDVMDQYSTQRISGEWANLIGSLQR
jgi:glycosyltransferase involved in cell wall biosynthesis